MFFKSSIRDSQLFFNRLVRIFIYKSQVVSTYFSLKNPHWSRPAVCPVENAAGSRRTILDEQGRRCCLKKVNQSFYRISAEEDVFNRYYHKPLTSESVKTYSAAEIYHWLKQKSPESMRNISVQRLAQTLSAIGIERIHTYYGNLYRVVSLPSQ